MENKLKKKTDLLLVLGSKKKYNIINFIENPLLILHNVYNYSFLYIIKY